MTVGQWGGVGAFGHALKAGEKGRGRVQRSSAYRGRPGTMVLRHPVLFEPPPIIAKPNAV